jgi:hypothetical protein
MRGSVPDTVRDGDRPAEPGDAAAPLLAVPETVRQAEDFETAFRGSFRQLVGSLSGIAPEAQDAVQEAFMQGLTGFACNYEPVDLGQRRPDSHSSCRRAAGWQEVAAPPEP